MTARDGSYKKKGSLHPYARLSLASGGILIEPVYWRAYRRLEPRCQTILILQVCPTSCDLFTPMTSSCSRASRNLSPPPTAHTTPLSWNPVPINSRPVYDARSIKEIPPTIPQEGKLIADMTVAPGERYCVCLLLQCVWCVWAGERQKVCIRTRFTCRVLCTPLPARSSQRKQLMEWESRLPTNTFHLALILKAVDIPVPRESQCRD